MKSFRPLRALLFFYEVARLFIIIKILAFHSLNAFGGSPGGLAFPAAALAAPHAIFPLIAMFLWRGPETANAYLPLYLAGKVLFLIALIGGAIVEGGGSRDALALGALCAAGDFLSLLGAFFLKRRESGKKTPVETSLPAALPEKIPEEAP